MNIILDEFSAVSSVAFDAGRYRNIHCHCGPMTCVRQMLGGFAYILLSPHIETPDNMLFGRHEG